MIGVLRNNLWSLQFNDTTNIVFANIQSIDIPQLQTVLREFSKHTTFQIGHLTVQKESGQVHLTFPGIPLSFENWLVCENAVTHQTLHVRISEKELQTLLEYVVHMHLVN
jgi:hypothetical protein